ncbi:MAG: hypothetical protein O2892_15405 [Actinomycetota bacterium]|nr:hypothetical protein [Actinomycetota bacterium]MDA2950403.1 hypothetical protein [Actinomycetota bacterium]
MGTLITVTLDSQFRPTGVGNTCEGTGILSAIRAGTVMYFGIPFTADVVHRGFGQAQMQSSSLTGGTCEMTFLGMAPQGMDQFAFLWVDPFGVRTPTFAVINNIPPGTIMATAQPYSDPAQPNISQIVNIIDGLSEARPYDCQVVRCR